MSEHARTAELVGSLSLACDLGAGLAAESGLRTATLAARLARFRGHGREVQRDAYFSGLLRFLGCTGYAHEQALLNGGDDRGFISMFADVDLGSPLRLLARSVTSINADARLLKRAASVGRFLADPKGPAKISAAHCGAAVVLSRRLGMTRGVARALDQMYERWDGRGHPRNLADSEIDPVARILHVAHVVEVYHRIVGPAGARAEVRRRRGKHLDPTVASLDASDEELFEGLLEPTLWDHFLEAEPTPKLMLADGDRVAVAGAFAHYADLKSPYFLGHSIAVSKLAQSAATLAGLPLATTEELLLAGLLHDVGRVALPNGLLEKPGPLNRNERDRLRSVPAETARILGSSAVLQPLGALASTAYERTDGSGYHRGLTGAALSQESRLLAAAKLHRELMEDRPGRPAFRPAKASDVLARDVLEGRLDRTAVEAVLAAAGDRVTRVSRNLPDGLTEREVEVLMLLARGYSNRRIAERLGVSPRTVQTHVMHIFDKTGMTGRAAAALYAVERDLT